MHEHSFVVIVIVFGYSSNALPVGSFSSNRFQVPNNLNLQQTQQGIYGVQNQVGPGNIYSGGSTILCDETQVCPSGMSCVFSRLLPGNRVCVQGFWNTAKKLGSCPTQKVPYNGIVGGVCSYEFQCPGGQRCCEVQTTGASLFAGGAEHRCLQPTAITMTPTVTVLVPGYINQTDNVTFIFIGSVSLVQTNGLNVLFDTAGLRQRFFVLDALKTKAGLYPEDIDYVLVSHGHLDHSGNANLFPNAVANYNTFQIRGSRYINNPLAKNQTYYITNNTNLHLIQTPGHTLSDTSLIVNNVGGMGTVALVGDLFLSKPTNETKINKDLEASQKLVVCQADFIVPGHGPIFAVDEEIKKPYGCNN